MVTLRRCRRNWHERGVVSSSLMLGVEGFDYWGENMIFIFMLNPIIYVCTCEFVTKRMHHRHAQKVVSVFKSDVSRHGK
jgi:hypothetical protein